METASVSNLVNMEPTADPIFEFTDYNQRIAVAVLMAIIFIVGIIGNGLVLMAVAVSRKLHTSTNAFVVSLSVTDFLTCLVLPFQISGVLSRTGWMLPYALCNIIGGIAISSAIASVITLAQIAINRYVIITSDRRRYEQIFSPRNVFLMVAFSWLFPFMTMVFPQAIGYGRIGYTNKYKLCLMDGNHRYALIYEFGAAIIQLTCFVVITVCYGLIYRFLRQKMFFERSPSPKFASNGGNTRRVAPSTSSTELSNTQATKDSVKEMNGNVIAGETEKGAKLPTRREVQITRNLFYVVCAFFVSIIPYAIAVAIPNSGKVLVYLGVLVTASSILNPIIYGFNHPHFRVIFRIILRCDWKRIPEPSAFLRAIQGKR
ncbi:G-protein coupled receptor moody-like [Lytechinus variegatus]|uniref:G-protein coupled receptor moody-like n=1 Tax=Lytechinus variegatus TaxID=7654 RepID=UPI001BB0F6E4|nr:G-protein coupled receptor moody-like [Lytechinus variegatus]